MATSSVNEHVNPSVDVLRSHCLSDEFTDVKAQLIMQVAQSYCFANLNNPDVKRTKLALRRR